MWQVHHWPSSAWLPMCLVSSTCRCRWLQRRYILRFKKKQINYYINLTLFFSLQKWLTLVGVLDRLLLWCAAGRANHIHGCFILHAGILKYQWYMIIIYIYIYRDWHCTPTLLRTCPFKIPLDHLTHIDLRSTRCSTFRSCRARQKGGLCRYGLNWKREKKSVWALGYISSSLLEQHVECIASEALSGDTWQGT